MGDGRWRVGVGGNVDCGGERDINDTMVTSGGEI